MKERLVFMQASPIVDKEPFFICKSVLIVSQNWLDFKGTGYK